MITTTASPPSRGAVRSVFRSLAGLAASGIATAALQFGGVQLTPEQIAGLTTTLYIAFEAVLAAVGKQQRQSVFVGRIGKWIGSLFTIPIAVMVFGTAPSAYAQANDTDGDGTVDTLDNCVFVFNTQVDTDGDGYGNRCDADFNNDGKTDGADFIAFRGHYVGQSELCDLSEDIRCTIFDYFIFTQLYGNPPGPSAQDGEGGE